MTELTEAETNKMNTGRLMRAESDLLLPLLQTKQALAVGKIVAAFRAGKHEELLPHAAELSTIMNMKDEITRAIKQAEMLEAKAHGIK
jgi:hypothetical protein